MAGVHFSPDAPSYAKFAMDRPRRPMCLHRQATTIEKVRSAFQHRHRPHTLPVGD
jgi:hypothetical protein